MMEVRGIGQKIPRAGPEVHALSRFDSVFEESKKKMEEGSSGENKQGADLSIQGKGLDLPLDLFRATYLATNPMFVALQKWMEVFYKEIQSKTIGVDDIVEIESDPDYVLRMNLYKCLKKLLYEIVSTRDRNLQLSYLERVYLWFGKRQEKKTTSLKKELGLPAEQEIPKQEIY